MAISSKHSNITLSIAGSPSGTRSQGLIIVVSLVLVQSNLINISQRGISGMVNFIVDVVHDAWVLNDGATDCDLRVVGHWAAVCTFNTKHHKHLVTLSLEKGSKVKA